ncbi:collagen-like triple helix repeat-containing protein [Runella zeae]|uniref:collagen-like triple helix repeat-containing protein n=1 Tax=Runella zeae TaxID=94255 RepID=UPI0012FC9410|nr:collagen-like protein [Runella zeae]
MGDLQKSTIVPLNDSCFRLQLRSSRTALLKGDYAFQIAVEDKIVGVKKTTPVLISFAPSNNTTASSAVNAGSDVLLKVNILTPVVVANAELATIYKGEPGAQGPAGPTGATGAQGPQGVQGPPGSDATVTGAAVTAALGYTPVTPTQLATKSDTSHQHTASHITDWTAAWAARWASEAVAITSNLIPSGVRNLGGSGSGQHWNIGYISTINNQLGTLYLQQGGNNRVSINPNDVHISPSLFVFNTGTNTGQATLGLGNGGVLRGNTTLAFLVGGGAGAEAARFHSDGNFSLGSNINGGYKWDVNGTSRFQGVSTFSSSVGIGTTSPQYALDVRAAGNAISVWDGSNGMVISRIGLSKLGVTATPLDLSGFSRVAVMYTYNSSNAVQYGLQNIGTINQSGTAGYVANYTSIYEPNLGSGEKLLLDLGTNSASGGNSATHIPKFRVWNTGYTTSINDVEILDSTKGIILKSPDGTRYRISVANGGTLTLTAL